MATGFVQDTYNDFPGVGFPGQILDFTNSMVTESAQAEVDIPVAVGIAEGTAITDTNTEDAFTVKLPDGGTGVDRLLGIVVRTAGMEGEPVNTPASIPTVRAEQRLTYMVKGAIYVRLAKAVPANNTQVYVVVDAASAYNLGTLLPDADGGNADALTGAFFRKATAINEICIVDMR